MRVANATLRGLLAALLIAAPSLLLPSIGDDTSQVVALLGLALCLLVTVEYATIYPSLIEFRDAPPFNRIRFLALFLTVFLLSLMARGVSEQSGLTIFVSAIGLFAGDALDFTMSPVRLLLNIVPEGAPPGQVALVRAAAGLAFLSAFSALMAFWLVVKLSDWPRSMGAFNVWINLPTFDPTTGGDVVKRLRRDGRLNLVIAMILPFVIPQVAVMAGVLFGTGTIGEAQSMIWTVAAWAFLPLSLFMRGIAMIRVSNMIAEKRRRSTETPAARPAMA
ncbi:MAG: hypothetical protein AAFR47_19080 [Pseudomonadota bacterium]